MKAIVFHEHGGLDKLRYEDFRDPKPNFGEVLIRVKACALNHLDIWERIGLPGVKLPLPHISGSDISGVVEEIGEGVSGINKGDEVMVSPGLSCGICKECINGDDNICKSYDIIGLRSYGGYAELVAVPRINILPKPKNLNFLESASIPLVFLTAWHMLVSRAVVKPGESVLVQAGGSGVGIAGIQIAKLFGAFVITTVGGEEKVAKAKELGADEVINYRKKDFEEEVKRITDKQGIDIVIEHIGPEVWEKSIRVLSRNGRLVTCGSTSGPNAQIEFRRFFSRHLSILGSYMGRKAELLEVMKFVQSGKLKPVVHEALPLQDANKAQRIMEERKNFGKIVLEI